MKKYVYFCCKKYKMMVAYTWQHHCGNVNKSDFHCRTITNPFDWVGRVPLDKIYLLPSRHPYWHVVVGIKQYNRIRGIKETISGCKAYQGKYKDSAREMIDGLLKSIESIKKSYGFKIIK